MTTPADEIRTAAKTLRTARFAGAMTATPAVAALLRARAPIAVLLEGVLSSAREASPAHEECTSWCSPDTCDLSAALAVARAINGEQQ